MRYKYLQSRATALLPTTTTTSHNPTKKDFQLNIQTRAGKVRLLGTSARAFSKNTQQRPYFWRPQPNTCFKRDTICARTTTAMERLPPYDGLPPSYDRATGGPSRSPTRRVEFELHLLPTDSIGNESKVTVTTISLRADTTFEGYQRLLERHLKERTANRHKSFTFRSSLYFVSKEFRQIQPGNFESVLREIMGVGNLARGSKDFPKKLVARSVPMSQANYEEAKRLYTSMVWTSEQWREFMLVKGWRWKREREGTAQEPRGMQPATTAMTSAYGTQDSLNRGRGRSPQRYATAANPSPTRGSGHTRTSSQPSPTRAPREKSPQRTGFRAQLAQLRPKNTAREMRGVRSMLNRQAPQDPRNYSPSRAATEAFSGREQRNQETINRERQAVQAAIAWQMTSSRPWKQTPTTRREASPGANRRTTRVPHASNSEWTRYEATQGRGYAPFM